MVDFACTTIPIVRVIKKLRCNRIKRVFSRKRKVVRKRDTVLVVPVQVVAVTVQKDVVVACVDMPAYDEKHSLTDDKISVDVFSAKCIVDRCNRVTECACGGLRIHDFCADMIGKTLKPDTKLCIFDSDDCVSDCISCIPCIVCHRIDVDDVEPSLERDFPEGDSWVFREEHACPSCLAALLLGHGTNCDVCGFDFASIMS
jgi:hypothetical protein